MTATILQMPGMAIKLDKWPNRIREHRMARKMKLREVADLVGTTPTQISRFETGEREIDMPWLRKIARVLRTDPGQLLSPQDNPTSLTEDEARVIAAMRDGEPHVALAVKRVAESLMEFTPEPADLERKRA